MFWAVLTIAMTAAAVAAAIIGRALSRARKLGERSSGGFIVGKVVPLVVAVLWGVLTVALSVHAIPAGHVGVVYQFGAILGQIPEGLQLTAPYQDVTVASVQIQRHRFDRIEAFSKETQDVFASATLNYSVSADAIQYLYRTIGSQWFDVLIEPCVMNFFKEESVRYESVGIAPQREQIRSAVRARLTEELAPYSITVHDFLIDNMDFRPEFKQAIEAKQIAAQDALRERERVEQRKNEAQQVFEVAKGEANATRERAVGQADANRALAASLTSDVLQYLAIQKLADKIEVMLVPSGQDMILDPNSLLRRASASPTPGPSGR